VVSNSSSSCGSVSSCCGSSGNNSNGETLIE